MGPCSQLPLDIGIYVGTYDSANLSEGTPLDLYYPGAYSCPAEFFVAYWSFAPDSDKVTLASLQPTGSGNNTAPRDMWTQGAAAASLKFWGSWSGEAMGYPSLGVSFESFRPGSYTAVAEAAWGQTVLLHFEIVPAINPLTCSTVPLNSSFVAGTNASAGVGPLKLGAYYREAGSNRTYLLALSAAGGSPAKLTFFILAPNWPLQFSPDPSSVQSWQYFAPNGTLSYPATFFPNECTLVRVVLPYAAASFVLSLEFSDGQTQTITFNH